MSDPLVSAMEPLSVDMDRLMSLLAPIHTSAEIINSLMGTTDESKLIKPFHA